MDLVESNLFTPPIILLQTVLEEVRHRSLPLYNRLRALIKTEDKRIWVFYNEYRSLVLNVLFRACFLASI
jgi:exosome complex exonuclease DIS3/RRP44